MEVGLSKSSAQDPICCSSTEAAETKRRTLDGQINMSLSEESLPREVLVCEGCNKSFAGLHPTNYDHHIQYSASCRLKRAIQNIKRKREKGLPDPQPPPIELRPLVEDDPIDFVPNDDDPDPEQPVNEPTEAVDRREWDSTEQFVSWVKRAKLSQSQTDEMLNLFRDQRMDMREALENIQSHRDVDRYLMSVIVGEVRIALLPQVSFLMVVASDGSPGSLALKSGTIGRASQDATSLAFKVLSFSQHLW